MNKEMKFLMYSTPQGDVNVEAVVRDETLWLTQKAMAQLFGVQVPAISKHLKNIYAEGELSEHTTISKMETVVQRGFRGNVEEMVEFYNLDAIISVGYRVNSAKATQFRIWATNVLKEYMIKGFVLDDERLKQGGQTFGKDYFRELLERIRSIRNEIDIPIWKEEDDLLLKTLYVERKCSLDIIATVFNKDESLIKERVAALNL